MKKNRMQYMKDYREKYGELMKEQTRSWFKTHPEYPKGWRERNRVRYNAYMRNYMQQHRKENTATKGRQ